MATAASLVSCVSGLTLASRQLSANDGAVTAFSHPHSSLCMALTLLVITTMIVTIVTIVIVITL